MSELRDQILALRADGKTYNEIAKITGASKGTISYYCGSTRSKPKVKVCDFCREPFTRGGAKFCSMSCRKADKERERGVVRDSSGNIVSKICSICLKSKPIDDYHFKSRSEGTYQARCKSCNINAVKAWQEKNPERYEGVWKRSSSNRSAVRRKAAQYNISIDDLEELIEKSGGLCEICKRPPNRWLVVDHCHNSEKVRGLLCESCNLAIGGFQDSPDRLRAAALYLEREPVLHSPYVTPPKRSLLDK